MKKLAILLISFASGLSLSFAQVATPTLYGDVDPEGGTECVSLSYNLRLGARDANTNEEVSMLQDYLGISPPTGYFGRTTLAEVKKFQANNGLLNSGYVGPLTRAKIKEMSCSGNQVGTAPANPGGVIGTSPVVPTQGFKVERSAANPLEVKAYFYLGSSCSNYTLDWGDGTNSNFTMPSYMSCAQVVPTEPFTKMHTYSQPGTYTVKFQTGGYPQQSIPITVGSTTICPDGMPPTGDGCMRKCPDGTYVVGNQVCPTTPCPKPGTVPVCPGTSTQVPYNYQTCSWDWSVCSQTSGSPSVRFIENPTLKLEYDSAGKESVLVGRTVVEISSGGKDIYIPRQNGALSLRNQNGDYIYVNSYSGAAEEVASGSGGFGTLSYSSHIMIPAGKSAKITFYGKVRPQNLFAGGYIVSLREILYSNSLSGDGPGINTMVVPYNKSNLVTVIGEVSPYISEVIADATPQVNVTIKGVRFHPTSNVVSIGGVERTLPSLAGGLYINTTLSVFGLIAGKDYIVQVTHPQNGASNRFTLVTGTPVGGSASAAVVGTPVLKLAYVLGSTGGEASLDASYTVEVKGGSTGINISKYDYNYQLKRFSAALVSSSGATYSLTGQKPISVSPKTDVAETGDAWIIKPGQTATFSVTQTWNPKLLFAGSYTAKLYLSDYQEDLLTDARTNAVTVVGEVSPYISMVTVDDNNNVKVTGQRFDVTGNIITIDGIARTDIGKGDATNIYFNANNVNLAPGGHFLQIKNSQKGDSNQYYFVVSNVGTQANTISASLSSVSPASQYVIGGSNFAIATYNLKTNSGSAMIRTIKFATPSTDAIQTITLQYKDANGTIQNTPMGVVNGVAFNPGLSIPVTTSGIDIVVVATFSGFQFSTLGGNLIQAIPNVSVKLTYIEALDTSNPNTVRTITATPDISSNQMTLVASKPTIVMSSGGTSPLNLGGETKLAEFTVTADLNGRISIDSLSLLFNAVGVTNPSFSNIRITNNGVTIPGATASDPSLNSKTIISFANMSGYEISAHQPATFTVYGIVKGTLQAGIDAFAITSFNSASLFKWRDTMGGNTLFDGTQLLNFPTNSYRTGPATTQSVSPSVSAVANQITTLRSGDSYDLFTVTVDNLTKSNPLSSLAITLDAPGSGVFKQIAIVDADTNVQLAAKSGLAGYLAFGIAGEYGGTKRFIVRAITEPTFASYYTTMQVQAVFDGITIGSQTIVPTGGRVFGPKMTPTNVPIMISDPMICQDGRPPVNGTCPPPIPTYSPTSLNPSSFQVLASSVRSLEQNYASALGGTVALSAPATFTPTAEIMNFTGLKRGANEVRVSKLKEILRTISPDVSIGCANLSTINTLYGPTTESCVKVFQTLNELEPTGSVNEATNRALNAVIAR